MRRAVIPLVVIALLVAIAAWCGEVGDTETVTQDEQTFAPLETPPAEENSRRRVHRELEPEAAAGSEKPVEPAPASEGEEDQTFELVVSVLDADGNPVADADTLIVVHDTYRRGFFGGEVEEPRAPKGRSVTDETGQARLRLPLEGSWGVHAVATLGTKSGISKAIYIKDPVRHGLSVKLSDGVPVRGRVVDSSGRGIADARVDLALPDWGASMTSSSGPYGSWIPPRESSGGAFAFAPIPVQEHVNGFFLRVRAEGYHVGDTQVSHEKARAGDIEIVLRRPVRLVGRLIDESGEPVAGGSAAYVPEIPEGGTPVQPLGGGSDADGRFVIENARENGGSVGATGPGFKLRQLAVPATSDVVLDLGDIVLSPAAIIAGRVVDRFDAPVPGVNVWVSPVGRGGGSRSAQTDADGRFEVAALDDSPHRIYAQEPGGMQSGWADRVARVSSVEPGATDVRIVMTGGLMLEVHITFAEGSEPGSDPSYTHVVATRLNAKPGERAAVDTWARGRYRLRYAVKTPGSHDVRLEMAGYVTESKRVEMVTERETVVEFTLRKAE